ncbi:[NiFe]-hydrogenase assembly chaperone HybE [Methylosinus trichosporium]|uniref:[NiFe]-hydrogenase assembly, chaperone, HybE n=2 Tax=Methylosinus TaxID=425 RepID=A0A2D2CWH7_METT3|nr:[NiFe]-hydrogenase assembly chaperone HybE [Methylosinus trichosporium]ATQ67063.1 [NiFe]-hydrogenase assembly, chaperone, HybE [Methylosinus trichosporium OB3b]
MNAGAIAERLAAIYREIYRRAMRDAPICNDALAVEAVGFRDFGDLALGVMVTPWFANLIAAPLDDAQSFDAATLRLRFPAGDAEFNVSELDGFGRIATCSLFSPMDAFADQDAARATAQAALDALFDAHLHDPPRAERAAATLDRRAVFFGRRRRAEEDGAAP